MRRFRSTATVVLTAAFLMLASQLPASAALGPEILWAAPGAGPKGNFDLDLQVHNGVTANPRVTYGTHSFTQFDAAGFFQVHNRFGFMPDPGQPPLNPFVFTDKGALNAVTPVSPPQWPEALRWVHETSTLARNPVNGKWVFLWASFPKRHPTPSGKIYGKNLIEHGWIGMKRMNNTANPWPDPDMSTLSAKEQRLFVGTAFPANSPHPPSDAWATGMPDNPLPGNTKYLAYSEPAAFYDGGTLYLALTGNYQAGPDDFRGDVLLFKSTDDGATWAPVNGGTPVLSAADATGIDSQWTYFTAASIHREPATGKVRLLVSGFDPIPGTDDGIYQGVVEFEFTSLASGTVARVGGTGPPIVIAFEPKELGTHTGAGTFHQSTGRHVMGKHWMCGAAPCPVPWREYDLSW